MTAEPKHEDISPLHLGLVHDILPVGCYASTLLPCLAEDQPNLSNVLRLVIDLDGMFFFQGKTLFDVLSVVGLVEVLHIKKHGQLVKNMGNMDNFLKRWATSYHFCLLGYHVSFLNAAYVIRYGWLSITNSAL